METQFPSLQSSYNMPTKIFPYLLFSCIFQSKNVYLSPHEKRVWMSAVSILFHKFRFKTPFQESLYAEQGPVNSLHFPEICSFTAEGTRAPGSPGTSPLSQVASILSRSSTCIHWQWGLQETITPRMLSNWFYRVLFKITFTWCGEGFLLLVILGLEPKTTTSKSQNDKLSYLSVHKRPSSWIQKTEINSS